jgi:hypothetical protein
VGIIKQNTSGESKIKFPFLYDDIKIRLYKLTEQANLDFGKTINFLDVQIVQNSLLKGIHF